MDVDGSGAIDLNDLKEYDALLSGTNQIGGALKALFTTLDTGRHNGAVSPGGVEEGDDGMYERARRGHRPTTDVR